MKQWHFLLYCCFLLLLLSGCESDTRMQDDSSISAVEIGRKYAGVNTIESMAFSGSDILWFNQETREIRFNTDFYSYRIPDEGTLLFRLNSLELFTAHIITGESSEVYEDLVLYHDLVTDNFYLYNGYPQPINTDITRLNDEIRQENWMLFLIQLRREGRLK